MVYQKQFEYGPLAIGIYRALISVSLVIPLVSLQWFLYHIILLVFLTFGLRPILEKTGLFRTLEHFRIVTVDRVRRGVEQKRQEEIQRKQRDAKFKGRHGKHPDLPRHW